MSEPTGTITFLSHLRQGIATAVKSPKAGGTRGVVRISLAFDQIQNEAHADLDMVGPGDIKGLDPRVVIRTHPRPGARDATPNIFSLVEFDQPDLPWRYTPAAPSKEGRLNPWLCLIVLADGEFGYSGANAAGGLPAITVHANAPLPDLKQSWAWAHVQLSGPWDLTGSSLNDTLVHHPERLLSRLLCPRLLRPLTAYTAFLVPAMASGAQAGLGDEVKVASATEPAWDLATRGTKEVRLPVYFEWAFETGPAGDFEALVTKLVPRPLPESVGRRQLDTTMPGLDLPAATKNPMGLEAALKSPGFEPTPWPTAERSAFVKALLGEVNQPEKALGSQTSDCKLSPPLYGRWHAAAKELKPGAQPRWFHQLNEDPRWRVAAGIGTQVVQQEQQRLMASAWRQLEGIEAINAELRLAQTARETATHIHERDLQSDDTDTVLQVTAPLHSRIAKGAVAAELNGSPIPDGVFEPQFRRIASRYGRIGRRQRRPQIDRPPDMLKRMNSGEIQADPAPSPEKELVTVEAASRGQSISALRQALNCGYYEQPSIGHLDGMDLFNQLACKVLEVFDRVPSGGPEQSPAGLDAIRKRIQGELEPRETIPAAYRWRLEFRQEQDKRTDPLEPIMAAPEFLQPMYEPLAALSQDWLLPGLDQVLPNSISLAVSSQDFIEAYMVGLNHEMARELLWHEFPTDQRGSYFRQFWDPRGAVAPQGEKLDAEKLKDIESIHTWGKATELGAHRPAAATHGDFLVLVLRGDLFKRYPNTVVYASQPGSGGNPETEKYPVFSGRLEPDVAFFGFELTAAEARGTSTSAGWNFVLQDQPSEPTFGFDAAEKHQGGLSFEKWEDLSWGHLASSPQALDDLAYIDLNAKLPNPEKPTSAAEEPWIWHAHDGQNRPGSVSAQLAAITQQKPVRVIIHGSDMLPLD